MASTTSGDVLPTGGSVFTTFPDLLFIPEFTGGSGYKLRIYLCIMWKNHIQPQQIGISSSYCSSYTVGWHPILLQYLFVIGGLVWILVASTYVAPANPLGWVMFVSVFCFVGTTLWFLIFVCGCNQNSFWPAMDAGFHFLAVVFYLSASVDLAYITSFNGNFLLPLTNDLKTYRLDISAVVMSHVATLLYFLHAIFSAIRWKRA